MFLIMGHAGFCPSAIVLLHRVPCYDYVVKHLPSPTRILKTLGPKPYSNHSGSLGYGISGLMLRVWVYVNWRVLIVFRA